MEHPLSDKSVLVIGAGGLGGPALLALGAAGVGRIVLCDDDRVESSNLNRQPIFDEDDLGQRKAVAAGRRLERLYPQLRMEALDQRFDADSGLPLARSVDLLLDGSDNFATKFLANDVALAAGRPLVHGGVLRYTAQLLTVLPGQTGCLRCLFEEPPPPGAVPTCATAGVLGGLAGLAGALMAEEAVRILSGRPGAYAGRMLVFEAREARARQVRIPRRTGCPGCEGRLPLRDSPLPACAARPGASSGEPR
jgi:molybdopterin/thiamine biosynthesis adenylyltransferase